MTDQAINNRIAEVCGFTRATVLEFIPDFVNDLNAMHKVEYKLRWEQREQYYRILADVVGFSYCEADTEEETKAEWNHCLCHASARARAEAFCRTLGLWEGK